jgi:hypothetical protein
MGKQQALCEMANRDLTFHLWRTHSITTVQYRAILKSQRQVCAIQGCRSTFLEVDHDHTCCPRSKRRTCGNCVRGLLCHSHNMKVAWAERKNYEYLPTTKDKRAVLAYIELHQQRREATTCWDKCWPRASSSPTPPFA